MAQRISTLEGEKSYPAVRHMTVDDNNEMHNGINSRGSNEYKATAE